jgi:hypothetical protein
MTTMNALIRNDDDQLTVALFIDAMTVVAYSALIVSDGLQRRGMDVGEAEDEAVARTAAHFKTLPLVVRGAGRALFCKRPCDLPTLASECHRQTSPEIIALARLWLAHRGSPNMLVRPFVH